MTGNTTKFTPNMADGIKDTMWHFLMTGNQKANIPELKNAVHTLINATTQKTAGQRKNKPHDVNWDELDMVLWEIVMEATCLVLSGKLDTITEDV